MKLKKSGFIESLIKINRLREKGFLEWAFYPGMLFGSSEKWWGDSGKRDKPHEGLDLCLFLDKGGKVHKLDAKTEIPLIHDGEVVKIEDDFLGKSVYVRHKIFDAGNQLCTVYGHTRPLEGISEGSILKEGDVIASLSDTAGKKLPPHLHLSMLWLLKPDNPGILTWKTMHDPEVAALLDPVKVMGFEYTRVNLQRPQ